MDDRSSGRFFQVDIEYKASRARVCVGWWVVEINLHTDTLEYIAVVTWDSLIS